MNILIADKLADVTVEQLEALGATVSMQPDLGADDLSKALGDSEVLVVRSTKVTQAAIEAASSLSLIIRAGAGVNTIDLECASRHGIYVTNCPGKNTAAVAELVIGLIIAADRNIVNAAQDLRNGKWRKKHYSSLSQGLKGRTLGIIGLGSIGKAVARRAQGLEMQVAAWSRSLTPETAEALGIEYIDSAQKVAETCDVVSVHLASTPKTAHFIDEDFLSHIKDGAIFINTSRGEVVDTAALKQAMKTKGLRVGLDVYENEPAAGDSAFEATDMAQAVTGTPHIGASTREAAQAIADEVVNIVNAYRYTGTPINVVNLQKQSTAVNKLVVRHYNKVGVLAGVLDELRGANINIEEMQNIIFDGGRAASCTLQLDDSVSPELIRKLADMEHIIQIAKA
ncbi:MAG: 3-phosphoglycerate dehydrogenase family protein [candidate division KSB1 bacterium]|nr:3-phosphoglycerate dehydrogenase family protein [candidate division KSB1 bacterium]